MSMKKTLSLLLVFAMLLLLLTGCHGARDTGSFEIPKELDTSAPIELTFWAKNDTNKQQTNVYQQAIDSFEALYPNIKINMRLYTDYGRIYNDVITNIATGTTPNICITYPDHIATYLTGNNIVAALDSLISDERYGLGGSELRFDGPTAAEIIPEYLEECKLNGTTYALPYMRSTEACYVNKTLVEKLGYTLPEVLTWDFVWEVSEAATAKDADGNYLLNGQKTLIPFIYKSTDNMMITMLKQRDAGYSTDSGEVLLFNDTTTEILQTVARHTKTGAFSTFKISGYPANFLNAGQCIFAVDSTAGSTWMGAHAPLSDISGDKFVEFETVVMEIPQFDTNNIKMISQGPSVCIFNKDDPQVVLASWLFMQYLITNDVQIAYSRTEGYVPVTSKAQNAEEYRDYLNHSGDTDSLHYSVKLDAAKLLIRNIENTFVTPVFNGSTSLRDAAGQLIEDVTKGVRRKKEVNAAFIAQLYKDATQLYRLDQIEAAESGERKELGPMPATSVVLLSSLAGAWVLILLVFLIGVIRRKKRHS